MREGLIDGVKKRPGTGQVKVLLLSQIYLLRLVAIIVKKDASRGSFGGEIISKKPQEPTITVQGLPCAPRA